MADNLTSPFTEITGEFVVASNTYEGTPYANLNANGYYVNGIQAINGLGSAVGINSVQASRCTAQVDVTSSTTLVAVTGLTANVAAAGVYSFHAHLATTSGASGGTKAAMGGTSTWTSINTTTYSYTASAVAVNTGTTATPGTSIAGSTAINIGTIIEGTVVVNAAGTLTVMFAQNASNGTASSVFVSSYLTVTRIA